MPVTELQVRRATDVPLQGPLADVQVSHGLGAAGPT